MVPGDIVLHDLILYVETGGGGYSFLIIMLFFLKGREWL